MPDASQLTFSAADDGDWATAPGEVDAALDELAQRVTDAAHVSHTITDNAIMRGDGTTAVQGSGVLIDDSDNITAIGSITAVATASLNAAPLSGAGATLKGGTDSVGTGGTGQVVGGEGVPGGTAIVAGGSGFPFSNGDAGDVLILPGVPAGAGANAEIILRDHGSVDALKITNAATPLVELNRAVDAKENIQIASTKLLGSSANDNMVFITGTSWALKVNNVATLTLSDVLHDFKSVPTQNHERLFTLAYGDNTPRTSSSWLRGPGYVTNSASKGLGAPWAVTIVGAWCRTNITTATSGSVTAEVYINNVVKSAADLVFPQADGTGWATQYISGLSIAAGVGDYIHIGMTESGTMAWDDTQYVLYCKAIV